MDLISILIIAIGLSADSFAVSVANGFGKQNLKFKHNFLIALSFAVFQALMPFLGWMLGKGFSDYIRASDHWVAFVLLAFIGFKMIFENIKHKEENTDSNSLNILTVLAQSLATSVDALIVGISFAFIKLTILQTLLIIAAVTLVFSVSGFCIGKKYGKKFSKHAEIIGGIILILLGTKILIEHLFFS